MEKNRTKALRFFGGYLASHTVILLLSQASFPTRAERSRKELLRLEKEVRASTPAPGLNFTHTGVSGEIKEFGSPVAAQHRVTQRPLALFPRL